MALLSLNSVTDMEKTIHHLPSLDNEQSTSQWSFFGWSFSLIGQIRILFSQEHNLVITR